MNSKDPIPVEAFPVGEFIQEALDSRDWSTSDLAARTGLSPEEIEGMIVGSRRVDVSDAERLALAFGTSAVLWLNLQRSHDRHVEKYGRK